ncbi:unnamed protein product [Durusdinium trenchii]|uniref:Laminin EGF-like domain-containing protein n=1 Tax=Durusdinium trenchii TaxID=1381693 RepID=A0ABP0LDP6_9DINO
MLQACRVLLCLCVKAVFSIKTEHTMKCLAFLLPLAYGWWCETSKRHGCRGQSRQLVRETTAVNPFLPFTEIKSNVGNNAEPIVVDWDKDGDWDVILKTMDELLFFEFKAENHFVQMEPSPFKGIPGGSCRPAVADWDGDGRLDLIVGAEDGIRYYQKDGDGQLQRRSGGENPFEHIYTKHGACSDLSIEDWDGDGDLDLLVSGYERPVSYFERSGTQLVLLEGERNPFHAIANQTITHRAIMTDWNGDGYMDVILMVKLFHKWTQVQGDPMNNKVGCPIFLYEQKKMDGKMTLSWKDEEFFRNPNCRSFDGSGASFVDIDQDGDQDAVFGSFQGPLHVYERTSKGLVKPEDAKSSAGSPLDMIQVDTSVFGGVTGYYYPVLADWDLDGDLDLAFLHYAYSGEDRYFEHLPDNTVKELTGPPNTSCPIDWSRHFSFVDFDGDGKKDLLGFQRGVGVVVCVQTSSGFEMVQQEDNPFYSRKHRCYDEVKCTWDGDNYYGYFSFLGYPSFLDWDADSDMDMLRITTTKKVYLYEQHANGTFTAHALPLPTARAFSAEDFDGDGDIDMMILPPNSENCLYFERREDGSLEQLFGTDNPFDAVCQRMSGGTVGSTTGDAERYAALADWDGDGETDLLLVGRYKVNLWSNRPKEDFVEVVGQENPFAQLGLFQETDVTLVDVNGDGKMDVVFPPQSINVLKDHQPYKYFRHEESGLLEQLGPANPFEKVGYDRALTHSNAKNLLVDVDGDGDLDIVHGELHYTRNDGGHFTYLDPADPDHPFRGIHDTYLSCWTFVDWDQDGYKDLVHSYLGRTLFEQLFLVQQVLKVAQDMKRDGVSAAEIKAWMVKQLAPQIRFYQNTANASFQELTGSANPFHEIDFLDINSMCPSLVDLDQDGTLELVMGTTGLTASKLLYYVQQNGTWRHMTETPFDDLSIHVNENRPVHPRFVDWDNDGSMDLILTGTDRVQFFQRGVCKPLSSYCRSGFCDQQSSKCRCSTGEEGEDCSLCGMFHFDVSGSCRACPGHNSLAGTCSRRGQCEDDEDARMKNADLNMTGFKVASARGTGRCTCAEPFFGPGCEQGLCPPGQRLDRHALGVERSEKYQQWQLCAPCQAGRFKNSSGNEECSLCPAGQVPVNGTHCLPCSSGTVPSPDVPETCVPCAAGDVALTGAATCTPCPAGTAPDGERSACVACEAGAFARPRSKECSLCPAGTVPNKLKSDCNECMGQTYALEGDEVCQTCAFPSMILGEENWCTPLYTMLFVIAFILLSLFILAIFGRLRLECLKRRLNKLAAAKKWQELHSTQAKPLEYGLWQSKACKVLAARKADVKSRSLQLGISLQYVFEKLETVYEEKAQQVEWRMDEWGPVTKSGFLVKVRNCKLPVDPHHAWHNLPICDHSEDPNFHQVAGVLAYGPWALGKGLCCPRDGRPDCSIVDALEIESNSARATWFLSWVWGYRFTTVVKALARWWQRHRIVSGAAEANGKGTYVWWCVFVNNQFRMLEEGQEEAPDKLFHVFGQQLEGIGKMLMCLDQMRGSQYTSRIWCIFEVFVACQRSIPTTWRWAPLSL